MRNFWDILNEILFLYLEFEVNIDSETLSMRRNFEVGSMTKKEIEETTKYCKVIVEFIIFIFFNDASCNPLLRCDIFVSEFGISLYWTFYIPTSQFHF